MKLYVTTVSDSFHPLPIFGHKKLHLRICIWFELNIVTWSTKILKGIWGGAPCDQEQSWENMKNSLLDALEIHCQMIFAFHFVEWTKWIYYQFIDVHRFWLCYKFQCSIFSKGTLAFDFIKYNLIWKLAYKVKSWMHNWEGLTACQSFLISVIQQLCSLGFPIKFQLVGGHLGQNWQKLDENYKICLWGGGVGQDVRGTQGDKPIFWVVVGSPNPPCSFLWEKWRNNMI